MRAGFALLVPILLLAGCINEFEDPAPQHYMRISGIDVSAPTVTSGQVELLVAVSLDNTAAKSPEVELQVKAFDTATQLLVTSNQTTVGAIEKDKTEVVEIGLWVPRVSSYRLDVLVSEDGRTVQRGSVQVGNVVALERNLFETGLSISEMDFLARNVSGSRVTIAAKIYITNEGSAPSKELRMQVKAREVSTALLADEAETVVEAIGPEATETAEVELNVPGGYNYQVEAVLWDGEFIVERGAGNVQLLPNFTKPKGQDLIVSTPRIDDFVNTPPEGAGGGAPTMSRTPGPGLLVAIVGLATVAILVSRRKH